jgi:DNA-nicking Smr family endonuclease
MKRRLSSSIPNLSEPTRRPKRVLSEEERVLWDSAVKQTKPLRKRPRLAQMSTASTAKEAPVAAPAPPAKSMPSAQTPKVSKPGKPTVPPLVPLGRRQRARLSRGKEEIDARLDLHGMTQVRAHRALFGFLQRAHSEGLTFVLVITGKGKAGRVEFERGVLRQQVPHWLSLPEFRGLVVGFEEAHIGHGGEGALYVRVRRSRD